MSELNVKTGLDASGFETGIARLQSSATSFARGVGGLFAGAFAFDRIISGIGSLIEKAGKLQDISDKFGISAESVQRIGNAAEQSGGSIEGVAKALGKIGLAAQEAAAGDEKLQAAFADIKVSGQQLVSLSPEQLFYKLANAMNDGSLAGKDLAVAKTLLGKGYMELLPILRMTEAEIRAVGEASGVLSDDAVAKLDQFGDSWTRLSNKVKVGSATMIDAFIRLGEEIARNPMGFIAGDWDKMEQNMNDRIAKEKQLREASQARARASNVEPENLNQDAAKDFQRERDRMDVAEARQELRVMDAGFAGAAAAERILKDFDARNAGSEAKSELRPRAGSSMEVLADSLQRVGGGGQFAQIGGADAIQRDQLSVLKNIEKNTAKTGEAGVTPMGVE